MKIPDNVFETRCRWCIHGRPENENREVPDEQRFSSRYHDTFPCGILGISQANKVPGECMSFHPNWIFGICGTCMWSNQFHDGFCTRPSGPENKRVVFLGREFIPDDYWTHYRSTCDRYKVRESVKELIMRDVLRGRSPANFDPITWEPLTQIEGTPAAEQWKKMQEEARRAAEEVQRAAEEAKQEARDAMQEPAEDQFSLF